MKKKIGDLTLREIHKKCFEAKCCDCPLGSIMKKYQIDECVVDYLTREDLDEEVEEDGN